MSTFRRVATISFNATLRTYLSGSNLFWIVAFPILLSFLISLWLGSDVGTAISRLGIAYETPRGDQASREFLRVSKVFGVYLIFCFSTLLTRAGNLHDERRRGTLQRTLVAGVPYSEIVAAHLVSLILVGALQAVIVLVGTGLLGTRWLATGWGSVILPVAGTIFAASGIALGIAGLLRNPGIVQLLAGGAPSILALMGGAFFPLDVAPAGVQRLAAVNPMYWAMEALSGGFVYSGWASQAAPMAILFLFGVIGMVIGVQGLRRFEP